MTDAGQIAKAQGMSPIAMLKNKQQPQADEEKKVSSSPLAASRLHRFGTARAELKTEFLSAE
jgi:hypothetical protein